MVITTCGYHKSACLDHSIVVYIVVVYWYNTLSKYQLEFLGTYNSSRLFPCTDHRSTPGAGTLCGVSIGTLLLTWQRYISWWLKFSKMRLSQTAKREGTNILNTHRPMGRRSALISPEQWYGNVSLQLRQGMKYCAHRSTFQTLPCRNITLGRTISPQDDIYSCLIPIWIECSVWYEIMQFPEHWRRMRIPDNPISKIMMNYHVITRYKRRV